MTTGQTFITGLIRAYQIALSPLLGQRCRFHPTCSAYMAEAIARRGSVQGMWLGVRRLMRCHPWSDGGVDPVPERTSKTSGGTSKETCCAANPKCEP